MEVDFMFGISEAIKKLRPKAKFELYNTEFTQYWDETGLPKPSWSEIISQYNEDKKLYDSLQYARDRKKEYPSVEEQLDMLWHSMDSEEISGKETLWFTTIREIKNKFPKP